MFCIFVICNRRKDREPSKHSRVNSCCLQEITHMDQRFMSEINTSYFLLKEEN